MSETADALMRRIESIDTMAADNRARAESFQRMSEELKETTGRAVSDDGIVTVVASSDGAVKSVVFADGFAGLSASVLSASTLHTIARARADAARAQAEVVRRGLGDTELLDRVLNSSATMFGDERAQDPGPSSVPAPTPRRAAHDDEGEFSVFKNNRSAW
ncbi:hypothetical protein Lesp02_69450 [Lentzea sp. NBRC 105346]|uniref:YbaB/EbfC family nucleoid-associated protein n=1 Tax=Lentzea sp. NBRC 105346 TaxID=3032205 RepID=UPI0024A25E71|nr:YbaB/EbfC family nucleoid-associated protein [Lentzea sp. NBRC 105346]GLZ34758.1 hypothetical protein Lesp02_69450 [Lentzea sp. NBRC 105346]